MRRVILAACALALTPGAPLASAGQDSSPAAPTEAFETCAGLAEDRQERRACLDAERRRAMFDMATSVVAANTSDAEQARWVQAMVARCSKLTLSAAAATISDNEVLCVIDAARAREAEALRSLIAD